MYMLGFLHNLRFNDIFIESVRWPKYTSVVCIRHTKSAFNYVVVNVFQKFILTQFRAYVIYIKNTIEADCENSIGIVDFLNATAKLTGRK